MRSWSISCYAMCWRIVSSFGCCVALGREGMSQLGHTLSEETAPLERRKRKPTSAAIAETRVQSSRKDLPHSLFPRSSGDRLFRFHHAVLSTIDKPQIYGHTTPRSIKLPSPIGGYGAFHMACDDAPTTVASLVQLFPYILP
jgi:hypothetical protein